MPGYAFQGLLAHTATAAASVITAFPVVAIGVAFTLAIRVAV